jgi:hypothetical protein
MENTSAPIKIDVESPIEIYSGLKNAGKIFVRGPLAVYVNIHISTVLGYAPPGTNADAA